MKFTKDNWRNYPFIITDSLWLFKDREPVNAGSGNYPGKFCPQIPHQLIERYTDEGDYILDPFAGSGTTIDVCNITNRHCFAFDLKPTRLDIIQCDAAGSGFSQYVNKPITLAILHPPYSDIIVYSLKSNDLSNPDLSVEDFLTKFKCVVLNCKEVLSPKAKLAIVIGDKYTNGRVIPLGFMCMQVAQECSFSLKAIVVKNFGTTTAKRNLEYLWRYRAMVNGFYIFKHEYIMVLEND